MKRNTLRRRNQSHMVRNILAGAVIFFGIFVAGVGLASFRTIGL
jgi:hypothetical protein